MTKPLLAASFLALAVGASAQRRTDAPAARLERVPQVLRLALRAFPTLTYSGTRTVSFLEGANRVQHSEYVLRNGPRTRIWFPRDSQFAGQVILELANERRHYFPAQNEIHVGPAKREEAFGRLVGLARQNQLNFQVADGGPIAGHPTSVVSILAGRQVVQKLWIEPKKGMVLRRDLFDRVGGRSGHYEFTEIDFSPKFDANDFTFNPAGAKVLTQKDLARRLAERIGIRLVTLPDSERYVLESARLLRNAKHPILHQTYLRGPATLSLFQAKGILAELPVSRWAGRSDVRAVTWTMNGHTFALVGSPSADEVRRLARLLGMR